MATEDFFTRFDSELKAQQTDQQQKQQRARHYRELAEVFVQKLKPMLQPYLKGLADRGFIVEENDNKAYYNVRVRNTQKGTSVQIGTARSAHGTDDEYYILSDFEEYGRQTLVIDETFPKDKITALIEKTFQRLL